MCIASIYLFKNFFSLCLVPRISWRPKHQVLVPMPPGGSGDENVFDNVGPCICRLQNILCDLCLTIKALYIKRPIKKSGEDFRKTALRRHKSFSISIVSILICSRNNRGAAWSRNVSRHCFWDCNWGRTGHGQLLVNSFPCT